MSPSTTKSLRGLRVLVAEDDLLISEIIGEILLQLECAVIGPVRSQEEALRAIRTQDIDAALLDFQLGEASIQPAANELTLRGIPFILMTGYGTEGGFPAPLANAPLLGKPFRFQQLVDLMNGTFALADRG